MRYPFRKADLLNNSDRSSLPNNKNYVWNVVALACERKGSATPSEKQRFCFCVVLSFFVTWKNEKPAQAKRFESY